MLQPVRPVGRHTWQVLLEWRRDCGDYVVAADDRIEVERDVILCGRLFEAGTYHWHMLDVPLWSAREELTTTPKAGD